MFNNYRVLAESSKDWAYCDRKCVISSGHVYVFKKAALTVKMATLIISRLAKFYCNRSIALEFGLGLAPRNIF